MTANSDHHTMIQILKLGLMNYESLNVNYNVLTTIVMVTMMIMMMVTMKIMLMLTMMINLRT